MITGYEVGRIEVKSSLEVVHPRHGFQLAIMLTTSELCIGLALRSRTECECVVRLFAQPRSPKPHFNQPQRDFNVVLYEALTGYLLLS